MYVIFDVDHTLIDSYSLFYFLGTLKPEDVVTAARALGSRLDPDFGGFGRSGPKFPNPMQLSLVLRGWRRSGDEAEGSPVKRSNAAHAGGLLGGSGER